MSMMCRPKWPFLHMYGSHDMRHVDFRGLTGSQRTPRVWGVTVSVSGCYTSTFGSTGGPEGPECGSRSGIGLTGQGF